MKPALAAFCGLIFGAALVVVYALILVRREL